MRNRKYGSVTVVNRKIELSPQLNQREKIFDANGVWVGTKPLVVENGVLIKRNN